jgi:integrase
MIGEILDFLQCAEDFPEIPEAVHDRFGNIVDVRGRDIRLHDPVRNCVLKLERIPDGELRYAMRYRIAYAVGVYAPTSIAGEFETIKKLLELGGSPRGFDHMTIDWWRKLRATLRTNATEWSLHALRLWYLWLEREGFPGIHEDIANEIEDWRIPGMVKGEAVRVRDPERGPLTWSQFAHLITRLTNEAAKDVTTDLALVKLCVNLGLNSRQLALLEERDLSYVTDPETGEKDYFLDVPRIKKRLAARETKRRHIERETGEIIETLIGKNRMVRGEIEWEQSGKMPIFCRQRPKDYAPSSPLRQRFEWHLSTKHIQTLVCGFSESIELRAGASSERFWLSPRRLRYTFATMLAATGAPPRAIAEALDHTDLQHVGVYVQATGKLADRLNNAIGAHLEPWVKRFIEGPEDSIPTGRANTIYHPDPTRALGIGYCGSSSRCGLYLPDSCYGCDFFQPWKEADHQSVLERLLMRKSELLEKRANESDRIPHQLDAAIEGVQLVIAAQAIAEERVK